MISFVHQKNNLTDRHQNDNLTVISEFTNYFGSNIIFYDITRK